MRATVAAIHRDTPAERPRRRGVLLAAALLAALAVALGAAVAAPAAPASAAVSAAKPDKPTKPGGGGGGSSELAFAAVGDSFAAGVGAGSYLDTSCYRSSKSYPKLIDADANRKLVSFPACSGASTVETLAQVATISTTAKLVTVTVGGNDVGFSDVMRDCFVLVSNSCQSRIDAGAAIATSQDFRDDVAAVIAAIRNRTEPDAKIVVTGYPLLFHENSSGVNPKYTWADEVNDETAVLNGVIQSVAESNGAVFVDVMDDFAGHGIGSTTPWINDWSWLNTVAGFHPNATGYVAYANAIRAVPVP
ncbi:SGNH/GDSL hydrolase family protein [Agromyces aurantiacus]|uniref:SGNH/GDSL hydrolase family protein n=1 Tax=Agromyces aurantiacus TaxID=165814 RepID=A0ABV9R7S3_9MICO|nr:SGNH/GDSL hydrolase family protein [Agromyces aurantiacus]MBM7504033.1 lysophospholipase L1-like esterase [Agromyces aurantiacus]